MDAYYLKSDFLILTLALPVIIGASRFRLLDKGSKIIFYITVLCLVSESLAYLMAVKYRNNMVVYNLNNLLEVFLTCFYFNIIIDRFRKKNIGRLIGIFSLVVWTINILFFQSINSIISYFLFYQALVTVAMSLTALSTFLKPGDRRELKKEVHFWFPVILIFCWSMTYLLFSLVKFYSSRLREEAPEVIMALYVVSIVTNMAFAFVFYYYPKLRRS